MQPMYTGSMALWKLALTDGKEAELVLGCVHGFLHSPWACPCPGAVLVLLHCPHALAKKIVKVKYLDLQTRMCVLGKIPTCE